MLYMTRGALAFGLMLLLGPELAAQGELGTRGVAFGVFAGGSIPTGSFRDLVQFGYELGASLEARTSSRWFGVRTDVAFHRFEDDVISTALGSSNGRTSLLSATVNVVSRLQAGNARFVPYSTGGIGIYRFGGSQSSLGYISARFGLNAGVGLEVLLGRVVALLEARYHNVPPARLIPISLGVRF